MQVQLSLNGRDFLALLESGSTHNFIDLETAAKLNLQQTLVPHSIKVVVASGDQISNVGIYNSLPIQIDT
jgi:predicted aspartyl protease